MASAAPAGSRENGAGLRARRYDGRLRSPRGRDDGAAGREEDEDEGWRSAVEGDEIIDDDDDDENSWLEPPPTMTLFPPSPTASSRSVDTYNSLLSSAAASASSSSLALDQATPPAAVPAPLYRPAGPTSTVRASDPHSFARLFPSLDRLAVRHDDAAADGNMSLRVDAAAVGVQLFHLRIHSLARRRFSLARYARDSGRAVCSARRAYIAAPETTHGAAAVAFPRAVVAAAVRSVKTPFRRPESAESSLSSSSSSASASSSSSASSGSRSAASSLPSDSSLFSPRPSARRPSTDSAASELSAAQPAAVVPTDTVTLDFSNYAHVEVRRRGPRLRYEFAWWGHGYAWRRSVDKALGTVSFHLVRDGHGEPVAHIVPEVRTPNQVAADQGAGGWIPPCYMWISDPAVVRAVTDVADIIVATGLVALVDDCIRARWPKPAPLGPVRPHLADAGRSRSTVRQFFSRRTSAQQTSHGPLRVTTAAGLR